MNQSNLGVLLIYLNSVKAELVEREGLDNCTSEIHLDLLI